MDKIPTDELVEIVKRRGLNGNVHKTEEKHSGACSAC